MAPRGLFNAFDPTVLFLVPTVLSVLFLEVDVDKQTLTPIIPSSERAIGYFTDPAFAAGGVVLLLAVASVWTANTKLTVGESLIANWYLWNCVIIHVMMDGMAGGYNMMGLMGEQYMNVDRRFRYHLIGKPGGTTAPDSASAWVVCTIELTMHSFLTFFAFVGVCRRSPWRHSVESFALAFQFFGSLVFPASDLLTGCENMQPIGVHTCAPPVTPFFIFFFYFGVLVNFVWALVPAFCFVRVVMSEMAEKANGGKPVQVDKANGAKNGKKKH